MNESLTNNKFCSVCGTINASNTQFCIKCRNILQSQNTNNELDNNNSYQSAQQPIYNNNENSQVSNKNIMFQTNTIESQNKIEQLQQNNWLKKKKINFKGIISILIIIVIIICGIFIGKTITGLKDDTNNYNIIIKKTNGIEAKAYISPGGDQLIVSAINKSGKKIGSGYIEVNYYDENGNIVKANLNDDKRYNMFENEKQIVFGFELPTNNNNDYYIPNKTEIEITIDEEYQEQYATIISKYSENFTYSYSTSDEGIITLNLKNNANNSEYSPRVLSAVFYKNNKPVYSKEVNFYFKYVKPGETVSKEFNIPNDYKKTKEAGKDILIDYDSIEIYRIIEGDS